MTETDQSVMIAALVALVAVVGLVVQFSGAGMLPTDYGAAFTPTYPQLAKGQCPDGYTQTGIVCSGSSTQSEGELCYRTAKLYCVPDTQTLGNKAAPSEYSAGARFVAREQDCFETPADENGNTYYMCS